MRFKKKIPRKRWTWHFCFWNHKKIGQAFTSTQSASPQDWVWNCIYVSYFIHSFTYSYFWKNRPAFTSTQSASPATLIFELIYLNVYLDSCLFLGLNLIPIQTQAWHPCFLKSSEIHPRCGSSVNSQHLSVVFAYGHTTPWARPDLVRSRKLSRVGPG